MSILRAESYSPHMVNLRSNMLCTFGTSRGLILEPHPGVMHWGGIPSPSAIGAFNCRGAEIRASFAEIAWSVHAIGGRCTTPDRFIANNLAKLVEFLRDRFLKSDYIL